jgi:enamine deaminase RidA (YjgF/YER057c/UK114 family)
MQVDAVRQVSVATGSKPVFVAGQVAWRTDGTTIGIGDLAAQVEQCYLNVATVLAAVGASLEVAKWTVYAVD